jgi:hypothetical protein
MSHHPCKCFVTKNFVLSSIKMHHYNSVTFILLSTEVSTARFINGMGYRVFKKFETCCTFIVVYHLNRLPHFDGLN